MRVDARYGKYGSVRHSLAAEYVIEEKHVGGLYGFEIVRTGGDS